MTTNYEKRKRKQRWDINRLNNQEIPVVNRYQDNIEIQTEKTEARADIDEEWTTTSIKTITVDSAKEIIRV
jgi:hypothetical protein